ncbi:DUF1592 domain-containing protein [Paludisphaera mucosa]|uniref:DUF1592 domain-containing protein n=1 Tax=Paludisphaera mucosa TaxID=3030827 RepID=A0ABT6FEY3_9BACT|nr:DUF1592 domain-containing protein [Paludisphaera mucosa]MDG3006138.1 DUF1592 domain-containing protein [Paludisphaera mucosa]
MFHLGRSGRIGLLASVAMIGGWVACLGEEPEADGSSREALSRFVGLYCAECHNAEDKSGDLDLERLVAEGVEANPHAWEKTVRRLATRQMPPADAVRPRERAYESILATLEASLDRAAADRPNAGRTETLRRLNRTEYQNAIRDLLALDVDASALLPNDESSRGFDNITVAGLSPTLLDRYITAAQKISRLAIGGQGRSPGGDTFRIRGDVTQEEHVEGLPPGTRGGALIPYTFPQDGNYDVQVRLTRDRDEHVEGLHEPHDLEILLDRDRRALLTVTPPKVDTDHQKADEKLKVRIAATAGPHQLGVTFLKNPSSLLETKRQPYQAHYNMHRHPRLSPAVFQVSITGPYAVKGTGETPSRRRIFVRRPTGPDDEVACAREIVSLLTRHAYRRPVADADLEKPMEFYCSARADGDFDAGIEAALGAILVSPQFLFRIEPDPPGVASKTAYRISDVQLASRLSFFIWSSIPDDELLDLASRGELHKPDVLEGQVRRMLGDERSRALATNFAGQWLHLRNLDSTTPDLRLFPDFDDNLRQSFRQETELTFESVLTEDRSVLDLIQSDHAFLNERLAKHYGIPNVYGSRFRRVSLGEGGERGGLLRQGSILTVTSYATRTSPVIRGKWVLENILGTPPPPPPADVPALEDNTVASNLSVRERLAKHRADVACASCHKLMDPVGFSLENFDAVGRWRTQEDGKPADATGGLPDGTTFTGVDGLERALLKRPELFAAALTEKLMTFALGRGVETYDAPAVRKVVRQAPERGYRFSSLILGIASSTPFQMRNSE